MIIAADVGNSFVKIGAFASSVETSDAAESQLVSPVRVLQCALEEMPNRLRAFLPEQNCSWFVSSVNRQSEEQLRACVSAERQDAYALLDVDDVPIPVDVEFPERVGMDRLAAAVAASRARRPGQWVIVIDAG